MVRFRYYAPSGDSERTVEPYYLVFRWSSWYLWGWCMDRKDYRLFKLNRMDRVTETDKEFVCRDAPMPDLSAEKIFPGEIKVKEADDGRLLFTADYTDMENLVTWLMTFGAKAEVLEPAEARDIIRRNAEETLQLYEED